jgi:hypothetical protein
MSVTEVIASIDAEISRLQQARALLAGTGARTTKKAIKAGRKPGPKKRTMSGEARAKIAEAQRKRWAAQRKGAK